MSNFLTIISDKRKYIKCVHLQLGKVSIDAVWPIWINRSEKDPGIALLDAWAVIGDILSYYQDAVANEAYLQTARRRRSVKRHAMLLDYQLHVLLATLDSHPIKPPDVEEDDEKNDK